MFDDLLLLQTSTLFWLVLSLAFFHPLVNCVELITLILMIFSPHTGRYWEMVQRLKVTQLYLAPTSLRLLLKCGDSYVHKYDRGSLRTLGCGQSVG